MTTLYIACAVFLLVAGLIWAVYKLGQRGAKNKYENELLEIRTEKHKKDQEIASKPYVESPFSKMKAK